MADDIRPPLLKWAGKILTRSGGLTGDPDCCCKCPAASCYSIRLIHQPGFAPPSPLELEPFWPDYSVGEWIYWKLIAAGYSFYVDSVGGSTVIIDWFLNYAACGKPGGDQPNGLAFEAAFINWWLAQGFSDFGFSEQTWGDCKTDAQLDSIAINMAGDAGSAGDEGQFQWSTRTSPRVCRCSGGVA